MTQAQNVAIESSQINSSGVLQITGGGTGLATLTTGYIPYGAGTGPLSSSSNLQFNGTNLTVGGVVTASGFSGPLSGTATLSNGVNQNPNRTDGAWYQAVWSNAAAGDTNIYSTGNVTIYSAGYGSVGFYGSNWQIGGNPSWGLGSNTGLILGSNMAAPVYYDSNNTGYYCDPNNTSNFYHVVNQSPGISFQGMAAWLGVGANSIGFGWSSPYVYVGVDNAVYAICATVSDRRLKTDIVDLSEATSLLNQIRVVEYSPLEMDGSNGADTRHTGVIADEIAKIIPEVVCGEENGVDKDGKPQFQSVNYAGLAPFLVKGFQEQDAIIKAQQAQISTMQAQINALIAKVGL